MIVGRIERITPHASPGRAVRLKPVALRTTSRQCGAARVRSRVSRGSRVGRLAAEVVGAGDGDEAEAAFVAAGLVGGAGGVVEEGAGRADLVAVEEGTTDNVDLLAVGVGTELAGGGAG